MTINENVTRFIDETNTYRNIKRERGELSKILEPYGIPADLAENRAIGIYCKVTDDPLYNHESTLRQIYEDAKTDPAEIENIPDNALIVPVYDDEDVPRFMILFPSKREGKPPGIWTPTPFRESIPPLWTSRQYDQTVYVTASIGDTIALAALDCPVVYVQFGSYGDLDINGLIGKSGNTYVLTPNNDDPETDRQRLESCQEINPILSTIGRKDYNADTEDGKKYATVWDIYRKNPAELRAEIEADAIAINAEIYARADRDADAQERFRRAATSARIKRRDFDRAVMALSMRNTIKTGLENLDYNLGGGIFPGSLYVLGAAPSTGKTSFCVQLADEIVQQGYDVLFVSLEQSPEELIAKSISRLSYIYDPNHALNSSEILFEAGRVHNSEDYIRAKDRYQQPVKKYDFAIPGQMYVIRSRRDILDLAKAAGVQLDDGEDKDIYGIGERIGIRDLRDLVRTYTRTYPDVARRPVVIVDYLQIMKPEDPDNTDKQNADWTISGLRRIVLDYGVSLIAISSLSRAGYSSNSNKSNSNGSGDKRTKDNKPVPTMASLKESGGIEYGADVILMMDDVERIEDKREIRIRTEKNRNGPAGRTTFLDYYPAYNLFKDAPRD